MIPRGVRYDRGQPNRRRRTSITRLDSRDSVRADSRPFRSVARELESGVVACSHFGRWGIQILHNVESGKIKIREAGDRQREAGLAPA